MSFIEITTSDISSNLETKIIKKSAINEVWPPARGEGGCSLVIGETVYFCTNSYSYIKKQLGCKI